MARPAEPGEVWELPDDEAVPLVEAGKAVPVTLATMDGHRVERR